MHLLPLLILLRIILILLEILMSDIFVTAWILLTPKGLNVYKKFVWADLTQTGSYDDRCRVTKKTI
jgi:hypothetical protein